MSRRIFPFAPWELTNNKLDATMSNIAMDRANSIEKRECLIRSKRDLSECSLDGGGSPPPVQSDTGP